MQWRLNRVSHGWVIEYKKGAFSTWQMVNDARSFSWEPSLPKIFNNKKAAAEQMAKLIAHYG